jgi:hypothetical protein
MLGRRSFLISCGTLIAGRASAGSAPAETRLAILPPRPPEVSEAPPVELHITGWDPPLDPEPGTRSGVWISINRSWRAAWR